MANRTPPLKELDTRGRRPANRGWKRTDRIKKRQEAESRQLNYRQNKSVLLNKALQAGYNRSAETATVKKSKETTTAVKKK